MKNIKISPQAIWFLVISGICSSGIGIYGTSQDWLLSQKLLSVGGSLIFASWIILFLEIVNNKVYDRTYWILSMLFMPPIAIIFYLVQREKLFRLTKTKFRNNSN